MITDPEAQNQPLNSPYEQVGAIAHQPSAFSPDKHLPNLLILMLMALMVFTTLIPLFVDIGGPEKSHIGIDVLSLASVGCYAMCALALLLIVIDTVHRCKGAPDRPITPGKTRLQEIKPWVWLTWAFVCAIWIGLPTLLVISNETERNTSIRWAFGLGLILIGLACLCAWVEYTVATALVTYNNHMAQQQQQYQQSLQNNAALQNPYHVY